MLFVGSSSIRFWETLARDFKGTAVINRGFGGSRIADVTRYADRVVIRQRITLDIHKVCDGLWRAMRRKFQAFGGKPVEAARDPAANLFNACPDDLAAACRSLAGHPAPALDVVTGFWIDRVRAGLGPTGP